MPENQPNQKSSDEKSSEALMMGGAAVVTLVFLVKFLVPIVIGVVLAPLICLGLRGLPFKQKLRPFSLVSLNLSFLTYLLVGLPFTLVPKKEQFTSVFGDYTTGVAAHIVVAWDTWVRSSPYGFFKKAALSNTTTWIEVSQKVWSGLALGLLLSVVFTAIHQWNKSKKEEDETRTPLKRARAPELNLLGQILCLPASVILKWLVLKPAHEGHEYALSVRAQAFGFLQRMLVEVVLYSLLCIPFFFLPERFTDLAIFISALLALPLLSMTSAFVMGLIPGAGDAFNQGIFQSPYAGDSERNPFRKRPPQ